MAFDPNELSVLAYANGFTLWHYRTTDTTAEVNSSGYFDAADELLRTGDLIFANLAGSTAGILFVSRSASSDNSVPDRRDEPLSTVAVGQLLA